MVVCMRWSRYRGRAAVQTSTTDLMDEVSHTHLQFEHLHQTHMGPHNRPHSYNSVFSDALGHPVWVEGCFFSRGTLTSVCNMHSHLFISLRTGRRRQAPAFQKCTSSGTEAVASVKGPRRDDKTCCIFSQRLCGFLP